MKLKLVVLCSSMAILALPVYADSAKADGSSFTLQYEGGSLNLRQYHGVKALLDTNQLVLAQSGQRVTVPISSVSEIECGSETRRRFGATLLGLVPLMDLEKVEEHYVSLTWNNADRKVQVLFKLNRSEYRDFVSQLERLTGKKAIDATKTPTVVRYYL